MGFTRSTSDINVHQALGDYPTVDDNLTASELKQRFDLPANTLQEDLNRLETELESPSSASFLGASKINENDTSDGNVQAKLEKLYTDIQGAAMGQVPDASITQAKMAIAYEATLAKKNGELQHNLNAELFNGYTLAGLKALFSQDFYVGTCRLTANTSNTVVCGFKPKLVLMFRG